MRNSVILIFNPLFIICLMIASINHLYANVFYTELWRYCPDDRVLDISKAYWYALGVIDPLAAGISMLKPRLGMYFIMLILLTDVVHNGYYVVRFHHGFDAFYLIQLALLLTVLSAWSLRFLHKKYRHCG